ncbi:MAG TPA: hypothetical protein VIK74_08100 [Parasegetibacter sp.]
MLVFAVFIAGSAFGQDTLPEFSLKKLPNGKVVISWKNNYPVVKQISIQRSAAEKTGFKSILTLPDPTLPENGYVDATAPYDSMYYRLYILLDNGEYIFAKAKTPVLDTTSTVVEEEVKTTPDPIMSRVDSILKKQIPQKEVFKPSVYVYTSPDGNVTISLPLAYSRNYSLRFFDPETNQMIFELKKLKEVLLNLDKANFLKSGWFNFELYDGDKLIEKHKLFIPKDF